MTPRTPSPIPPSRRWLFWCVAVVMLLVAGLLVSLAVRGDEGSNKSSPSASADLGVVGPEVVRRSLVAGATPIDVRTATEFAAGHLRGARNIDVNDAGFADRIDRLDRKADYVVYCATGRRAALAIERMERAGFTELLNGGGYEDLAEAGLATAVD